MPLEGMMKEYRKPSFSEQLAKGMPGAVNDTLQGVGQLMGSQQHKKALSEFYNKNYGQDLSVLPEKEREILMQNDYKSKLSKSKIDPTIINKAQNAYKRYKELVDEPGIGTSGNWLNYSDEAIQNRGEFEGLEASIMPIFKQIFPRGMTEKEYLRAAEKYIPQYGEMQSTIRGKLKSLDNLLKTNGIDFDELDNPKDMIPIEELKKTKKVRFSPDNPEHVAKYNQLLKQFKGDIKKVNEILNKEYE